MNDQDQINEDERHEAATEEPINGAAGVRALPHFPSGADGTEPGADANKTTKRAIKWPDGFSVQLEKNGRKIVGVIERCTESLTNETYPFKYFATVYEGDEVLFMIDTCQFGMNKFRKTLKGAMNSVVMALGHSRRYRRNAAKRAAKEGK